LNHGIQLSENLQLIGDFLLEATPCLCLQLGR